MLEILSPRQREAMEHKIAGLTRAEAAKRMGIDPLRVRNLWQEARRRAANKHPRHPKQSVRAMQMSVVASSL